MVVTGPPGAGKSTVAAELASRLDPSVLIEGDEFFAFLHTGAIEPWLPASNEQNTVVIEAASRATSRFADRYDVIYDGVVGPWFLTTFAAALDLPEFNYVILLPSAERCVERVASRPGHGFTDEGAARKIHHEFASAEIATRHIVDNTTLTIGETIDAIDTAASAGRFTFRTH